MKRRYSHLTLAYRGQIERWRLMKMSGDDLVHFRQKFGPANVTTLIERLSRFLVVLRNPEKRAKPIMAQIAEALRPLPRNARRSVNFDRGSEFIDWPHLQAEIGARTWFCDPQSPWQRAASRMPASGCDAGCIAAPIPRASRRRISEPSAPA